MRVILAITMSAVLLAGTFWYTGFADSVRRKPIDLDPVRDSGGWSIQIHRTFECVPDPDLPAPALIVKFQGKTVFIAENPIARDEVVSIEDLDGVEQGDNELFVQATVASVADFEFDSGASHALKVSILRDEVLQTEKSGWLNAGEYSIALQIPFVAPVSEDHEHDHIP